MNQAIYDALVIRLQTVPGLYPLLKENQVIQAKSSMARATLIRSRPAQLSVGVTGKDLHRALFQVDLFVPVNTDTTAVNALADAVISIFPRGLMLSIGSRWLHIITSYRETAGRLNDQLHQVPVVIEVNRVS